MSVLTNAKRRELEPAPFSEIYMAMQERADGTLPKGDGRLLMESVRSPEHALRCLELVARHVAAKGELGGTGALEADWPSRKKWIAVVCQKALRMQAKQIVLDVFANANKYALSTYFAADMVDELGAMGAETALLQALVEAFRAKRPAGCKGVKSAYLRLMGLMKKRNEEQLAKAASATLSKYMEAAAAAAAAAAPAGSGAPVAPAATA